MTTKNIMQARHSNSLQQAPRQRRAKGGASGACSLTACVVPLHHWRFRGRVLFQHVK